MNSVTYRYPAFTEIRLYLLSSLFISLSIGLPFLLHQFGISGQIFLPLYLFSLLAGMTFGYRCGLLVGIFAPLISFALSGMPVMAILPFVIFKSLTIGLTSGILSEKLNWKNYFLTGAVSAGLTQALGILVILLITQKSNMAFADFKIGYIGIIAQLAAVPLLSAYISRWKQNPSQTL